MIQKGKAEYLLKKSYDKSRTLESFCKYESKRFNQAEFNSTYCQKKSVSPANVLADTQTDKRVDQIKIKYGLYPKRAFKHERSMTSCIQNKQNHYHSRQPLADHTQKINTVNFNQQSQKKSEKQLTEHRWSATSQKNKQNLTNKKIEKGILEDSTQKDNCNLTFNQSIFKNIDLTPQSHLSSNTLKNDVQKEKTEQIFDRQIIEKKEIWLSNLNPRIDNINRINSKIKSAIQNANRISLSNKKNHQVLGYENKQSLVLNKQRFSNDMIETRVVEKELIKQQGSKNTLKKSYLTTENNQINKPSRSDNRMRANSVTKNYYSINHDRQYSTSFKPQKLNFFEKDKIQKFKDEGLIKQEKSTLNQFSFETQRQQKDLQKQQTVRKNRCVSQNKYNMIRIKQDKSEYFDQVEPILSKKNPTMQSQKLSSMIKLALSSISAKKETKENEQEVVQKAQRNKQSGLKLIQNVIKRQIQLDEILRKAKYWLKYHNDQLKMTKIQKSLFQQLCQKTEMNGCNQIQFFSTNQGNYILKSLEISDQQIDPFYSVRMQEFTYDQIVESYFEAQNHWKKSIQNQKVIEQMIQSKWIDYIDMQRKGFATVTDLTRFVNFASQGFFKNRDLILIYRRLTLDQSNLLSHQEVQNSNTNAKHLSWFKESKCNKLTEDSLRKLLSKSHRR